MEELVISQFVIENITKVAPTKKPESLGDTEIVQLDDMVLDSILNKPVRRDGVSRMNSNANSGTIKRIWSVPFLGSDYVFAEVDVGASHTIEYSLNGTGAWSSLKTGLSDSHIMNMVKHKDDMYFVNMQRDNFWTDENFTTPTTIEITAPDVSAIKSYHKNAGSMTVDSEYRYVLVYISDVGERSLPSQPFTHYPEAQNIHTTVDGTNQCVRFDDLPASSDSRVVRKELFRTKADDHVFYYLASIPDSQTTYEDYAADTTLDTARTIDYIDPPYGAEFIITHKDRLITGHSSMLDKSLVAPPIFNKDASPPSGWSASVAQDYDMEATALSAIGNLTSSSTYKYLCVFSDENGVISDSIATQLTLGLGEDATQIDRSPLSSASKSEWTIQFYRTKAGGSTYYELALPQLYSGESYFDGEADANLTVEYVAPTSYNEWVSRINISEINKPAQFGALNYRDIQPDDGEAITGLVDFDDTFIVFKETSIHQVYSQGSIFGWRPVKISDHIGCDNGDSIQRGGNEIYFQFRNVYYRISDLKPMTPEFQGTLDSFTIYDTTYIPDRNWLVVAQSNGQDFFIYDEKFDTWYTFNNQNNAYALCELWDGTLVIGGYGDDNLLKYDSAATQDWASGGDVAIAPVFKGKTWQNGGDNRLRKTNLQYKSDANTTVTLTDPQASTSKAKTITTTGDQNIRESTDAWTGTLTIFNRLNLTISGGLQEFNYAIIGFRPIRRGSRVG